MLNTLESPGELQTRCSLKTGQTISSVSKYLSNYLYILSISAYHNFFFCNVDFTMNIILVYQVYFCLA